VGALVTMGVMANVVALNFFYDVPVKIYSSHLLILSLYLASPDFVRLANVLIFNRPTQAVERPPWPRWRWAIAIAFPALLLYVAIQGHVEGWRQYGRGAPTPALHGMYDVEQISGVSDAWSKVLFERADRIKVRSASGKMQRFPMKMDHDKLTLTRQDDNQQFTLVWSRPDADHLQLSGTLDGKPLDARLKKMNEQSWLLTSRGFHWVNEFPFNR
jgi:hypothetical protein